MPCDLHNMSVIKFLALVLGFRFTSHYSSLLSWLNKFYIYSTTAFFRLCSIKPCLGRQQVVIGCWIDLFLSIFIFFLFLFFMIVTLIDIDWMYPSFFSIPLLYFLHYSYSICIVSFFCLVCCFVFYIFSVFFYVFFLCFFVFFCVFFCGFFLHHWLSFGFPFLVWL